MTLSQKASANQLKFKTLTAKIETDLIMIMNKPDLEGTEFFKGTDAQKIVDISNIPVMAINPAVKESRFSFGTGL